MDWNVFFSTVSQTSGAIVGIFSAFLITKIIASQSEFHRGKEKISEYLNKSKTLANEALMIRFEFYNKELAECALRKIDILYEENKKILSASEYFDKFKFSLFQNKEDALNEIKIKIADLNVKQKIDEREYLEMTTKSPFVSTTRYAKIPLTPKALSDDANKERGLIESLLIRTIAQIKFNQDLLKSLKDDSHSSSLVSISIVAAVALFFLGVIYPLSFLPMVTGEKVSISFYFFWDILFSFKGVLLSIISIVFCGLMVSFFCVNKKLKYDRSIIHELEEYSDLRNYSDFFKNYVDNSDE